MHHELHVIILPVNIPVNLLQEIPVLLVHHKDRNQQLPYIYFRDHQYIRILLIFHKIWFYMPRHHLQRSGKIYVDREIF
jgi:hypothetical protein